MAKSPVRCPLTVDCVSNAPFIGAGIIIYAIANNYRGYIKPINKVNQDTQHEAVDFNKIKGLLDPWSTTSSTADENELKIKLRLFDVENSKETIYEPEDAKNVDLG